MNINLKFMLRRTVALLLALVLTAALFPLPTAHAVEKDEIYTAVEEQVRAFADSIDQKDAVNSAAKALAKHGMTKGGKKLSMGKSHALTATLLNSELLQLALIEGCTSGIHAMQTLGRSSLPNSYGVCAWRGANESSYSLFSGVSGGRGHANRDIRLIHEPFSGTLNSYDNALEWMAAVTDVNLVMERTKVTAEKAVYEVTCTVTDRFDFDTSKTSGFKKLISGIGALLFKEFDWESTVSFELTVPYTCSHGSQVYRWSYDPESCILSPDGSDEYTENSVTRHIYTNEEGDVSYYHELDDAVRLCHDKPWVLEYDVKRPGRFVFAPFEGIEAARTAFALQNNWRDHLFLTDYEYVELTEGEINQYGEKYRNGQWARKYCGTPLGTLFSYSKNNIYTLRLENEVKDDGINMLYITVLSTETGDVLLNKAPMDDLYRWESWVGETELLRDGDDWVSGKDLFIRYIGNRVVRFSADYFELRIWESGEEVETESYCTAKITKPTCAKGGYTTYTCAACGYSYTADRTPKGDHDCRGGVCVDCGKDTVTAAVEGTTFTLSGTLTAGTRILAACYDGDGRLTGTKMFLWNGEPICETIPAGESVKVFLTDENWTPLREVILL